MPRDDHGFERAQNSKCPECLKPLLPGEDTVEFGTRMQAVKLHAKCFEKRVNRLAGPGKIKRRHE